MSVRIRRGVAGLVVAVTLLVGCQPAAVPPSVAPTVVPTTSTPSPTPSPTPSLTAEQAAIKAGMLRYLEVYEKFARDPSLTEATETQHVTTGDESIMIIRKIDSLRQRDRKYSGTISYVNFKIGTPTEANGISRAELSYCKDLSGFVMLVASTGKPADVTKPTGVFIESAVMEKALTGKWVVAKLSNKEQPSC